MDTKLNGPLGRIARVRKMMEERGYDAVVIRDEANLRWLTGAKGTFDYTFEFPHVTFITADECYFHTDSGALFMSRGTSVLSRSSIIARFP